MEKIKPEVIGYKRVFRSGRAGVAIMTKIDLDRVTREIRPNHSIHDNGKQKFRPVYKKDNG